MGKKLIGTIIASTLAVGISCFAIATSIGSYQEVTAESSTKTIYLDAGGTSLWDQAGAVFFIHSWGSSNDDKKMTFDSNFGYYKAEIPKGNSNLLFVRAKSGTEKIVWGGENFYNQTGNKENIGENNCFRITDWSSCHTVGHVDIYTVSINNGSPITMKLDSPDSAAKYVIKDVNLNVNDKLSFTKNGEAFTPSVKPNNKLYINNLSSDFKILDNATTSIYFETANGFWINGYDNPFVCYFGVAGWQNVYAYSYHGTTTGVLGSWPGKKIEPISNVCIENHDGQKYGLYKLEIPVSNEDTTLIFNNNSNEQTNDLSIADYAYYGRHYSDGGDTNRGKAADFVWDLCESTGTYKTLSNSICSISSAEADRLIGKYNSLNSAGKSFADAATFYTYVDASSSIKQDWAISDIVFQLSSLTSNNGQGRNFVSPISNDNSMIVVMLICCTALFAPVAYVAFKKKKLA